MLGLASPAGIQEIVKERSREEVGNGWRPSAIGILI
jgi:hypothetical protein